MAALIRSEDAWLLGNRLGRNDIFFSTSQSFDTSTRWAAGYGYDRYLAGAEGYRMPLAMSTKQLGLTDGKSKTEEEKVVLADTVLLVECTQTSVCIYTGKIEPWVTLV